MLEALMPLLRSSCRKVWSDTVTTVDASPSGLGAVDKPSTVAVNASVGREKEHMRFRGPLSPVAARAPREAALGLSEVEKRSTPELRRLGIDAGFDEVPASPISDGE